MPKIKNWSKVSDKKWMHDETEQKVFIQKVDDVRSRNMSWYEIQLEYPNGIVTNITSQDTLSDAKDSARQRMKRHPNGWD